MNGRWRLAGMMALVYAVQGIWWPVLALHLEDLGISGRGRGWIFATLALSCILAPLVMGQVADRRLPAQRLLSLVYALGAGFLLVFALGTTTSVPHLFVLFLGYWLLTAPTYGLANTIALRNLREPETQFGRVRLWGTVGWMVACWVVTVVIATRDGRQPGSGLYEVFGMAAGLSLILAIYALTLPNTPPLARNVRDDDPGDSVFAAFLRQPTLLLFLPISFGVHLTTPYVYQVMPNYLRQAGLRPEWIPSALTLGQVPEIASLAVLPWLLGRLGIKGTLGLGILAWAVRFVSLAAEPPLWVSIAGIPLHGVAIACFTVGGQLFIDGRAPVKLRASSQAVLMVVTSGMGSFLGNLLAGEVMVRSGGRYAEIFLYPAVIDTALLAVFLAVFHTRDHAVGSEAEREPGTAEALGVCDRA